MDSKAARSYFLKGNPREIGLAMGRILGEKLKVNIDIYLQKRPIPPETLDMEKLQYGAMGFLYSMPARFQEELGGLAEGANLPLQRVAEWLYVEESLQSGCSGFLV